MVQTSGPIELGLFMGSQLARYASSKPLSESLSEFGQNARSAVLKGFNMDDSERKVLLGALSTTLYTLYLITSFMHNRSHKKDITNKLHEIQKHIDKLERTQRSGSHAQT
jgi:hypothetical protein